VLIILKAAVPLWKSASRFGQEADAKKPELAGCFAQEICPRHLPEYPRLGFCLAPRIKKPSSPIMGLTVFLEKPDVPV